MNVFRSQTESDELSREVIFDVLRNERRRYVLHYLKQRDGPVELQPLVDHVAAWENDKPIEEVTSEEHQRVYIALVQTHLPMMSAADVVRFDENERTVELSETAATLDIYLEIVPKGDIDWDEYYLWIAASTGVVLVLVWLEMYPLSVVPDAFWVFFAVGIFGLATVVHYIYHRRARLGTEGPPTE